ncbi:hypothetical protein STAS_11191 [Striga asiatica]|uniref:Uncharacterized protein n=1 Tax=Striga asiatica TaxID=4170 RepID=A0A5A7PQJ4_STRAF|nr:hypothetical protein STAS_11191 [Striga asiatica]
MGSPSAEGEKLDSFVQVIARSEIGDGGRIRLSAEQEIQQGGEKDSNHVEDILVGGKTIQNKESSSQSVLNDDINTKEIPPSNESHLVEVEVQPSTVGGQIGLKKKSTFTRKPRSKKQEFPENMQVDKVGVSGVKL